MEGFCLGAAFQGSYTNDTSSSGDTIFEDNRKLNVSVDLGLRVRPDGHSESLQNRSRRLERHKHDGGQMGVQRQLHISLQADPRAARLLP